MTDSREGGCQMISEGGIERCFSKNTLFLIIYLLGSKKKVYLCKVRDIQRYIQESYD